MQKLIALLLLAAVITLGGCAKKKKVVEPTEPLEPTAAELEVLSDFRLTPESPQGQRKLRELRFTAKKIAEAQAAADEWVEISRKKREAEAAANAGEAEEPESSELPYSY